MEKMDAIKDIAARTGGNMGGSIVATGTPEVIIKCKESYTGQFLKKHLK